MNVLFPKRSCVLPMLAAICTLLGACSAPSLPGSALDSTGVPLRPQQYLWQPERSTTGPVMVFVSIPRQEAVVYRNGVRIGRASVSTGKDGHRTPAGVFHILEKDIDHHSRTYGNAPMPYMERLTWDGVALHAGFNPGHPASHGCVRLPEPFARELYGVTSKGGTVIVSHSAQFPSLNRSESAAPVVSAHPCALRMSTASRKVAIFENGREIASAPLRVEGSMGAFHGESFFVYGSDRTWHRVHGSGQLGEIQRHLVPPADFARRMRAAIRPGTTMIITSEPMHSQHGSVSRSLLAPHQ